MSNQHSDHFAAIEMPGAFDCYFSGTSCAQGECYDSNDEAIERGSQELRAAYRSATSRRRGKGYSLRLELPSPEAVLVLREYADTCYQSAYYGDGPSSETYAALKVRDRCDEALAK